MRASYPFDSTALDRNPGLGTPNNQKNAVLSFTLGDMKFVFEPSGGAGSVEVPAKVLRCPAVLGSGLSVVAGGLGPHQDYAFLTDSTEYTYTVRFEESSGVVEKQMPAGAKVGQEGRMILYKSATLATVDVGGWTERLIRPFLITAADLVDRESGWPSSGAVPTIVDRQIVDNNGDGYNHV
jgi:hypothetical protein